MNTLPDHILKRMSPEDRAKLPGAAGLTSDEAIAKADAKSEGELQGLIVQELNRREIEFIQPRFGKKSKMPIGWPDFTFAYQGVPIGLEAKGPRTPTTKEQLDCHERLRRAPNYWRVEVVKSLAEVVAVLREIDGGKT
jgi:hypothetical protein